ncbi:amino acid transporter [Exiguobacterium sp. PvP048]
MIDPYSYLNGVFYLSQLLLSNFLFTLALLVYVIVSLVDMWKSYTRTSSKTDFLFFILTLITLFIGFLVSPFLGLAFQWKRSRTKRIIGILLIAVPLMLVLVSRFL